MCAIYVKTINKLIYCIALLGWKDLDYHYVYLEPLSNSKNDWKFKEECLVVEKLERVLKIKIHIHGPYYYKISSNRKTYEYPASLKNLNVESGAYVTSNLIKPLKLDTKKCKFTIVYEGASTLRYLNQNQTFRYWINRFLRKNSHLYEYENIILPDSPSEIIKPFDGIKNISVVKHFVLKENFEVISKLLNLEFLMNMIEHVTAVLIPPSELSVPEKIRYIQYISDQYANEVFLLKVHPKEAYFLNRLDQKNIVVVPESINYLPFELIIANITKNVHYYGYYSSVMLFFATSSITLFIPSDRNVCKIYEREYWSYIRLMKSRINNLNIRMFEQ